MTKHPQYFLLRAEEALIKAESMISFEAQKYMLKIVVGYLELAIVHITKEMEEGNVRNNVR